jgi:hypothetical protein
MQLPIIITGNFSFHFKIVMKEEEVVRKACELLNGNKKFVIFEICDHFPTNSLSRLRRHLEDHGYTTYKARNVIIPANIKLI